MLLSLFAISLGGRRDMLGSLLLTLAGLATVSALAALQRS